ncbi:MAG: outer membrane protein assembly factor BamD [Rhodospirillales bacterium]|jgi:outer membrane protein assembly factor BamD|nr:outer membrane protein assembly factor BamD [Rhodospirillales bacterium]
MWKTEVLRRYRILGAVAAVTIVAACGSSDEKPYVERPVDELYNTAMNEMEIEEYKKAAKSFDEVERQHPYSPWARKAQLMSAYAYYQANEYDDAIIALDRYIDLHPGSPDIAYAYYLRALSHYEQISDVNRDQEQTIKAKQALEDLLARFPQSKYARDARVKLDLTIDHLAGKEMVIGRYYQGQNLYLAAINRFRTVVEQYSTTTHAPEALLRLAECYSALGLEEEARNMAAVLGYNYPGSEWYADAYNLVGGSAGAPVRSRPWYSFW